MKNCVTERMRTCICLKSWTFRIITVKIVLKNTEVLEDEEFYGRKILRVLKEAERRNPGLTLKIQKLTTGGEKNAKDH